MSEPTETSWQCPPFESDPKTRLGWIEEQIQEGEGFICGQKAYKNLDRNMRIFDGIFNEKSGSTLCSNFLKYNIRKFVETISEVREIGMFGSDAPQFKQHAEMENKVAKAIYLESQYPRQLRKTLQFASVMGVGYLWPKCKATEYGFGERRIIFEPLGILDVVPVQVPTNNDIQEAYAVTIYEYMPIAEAHGRFPLFQSQLKPVNQVSYNSRLQARRSDFAERFHYGTQERNWGNLYCEIRYTFVRDIRINNTGYEIPMGDLNTSWFYKVPYVGQPIFGGIQNGEPFMRPAIKEDCRVYPFLRLMISSKGVDIPMYDGPNFDCHGMIPAVKYEVDDWPWEALGLSLVDNVASIEQTKRKHEKHVDRVITTKLDPPMGYDRTATGGPKIENFDIFEKSVRVGVDGKPKDILQSLLPEEVTVTEINFKFLELLSKMEKEQLGIDDLGSLMNMKMNVGSDSFDKALESVGPIAKGIASSMEASNAKVAYMLKFMIPQWLSTRRIMEYIGADNITPDILDFDPDSLVPSHMPDEYGPANTLPGQAMADGSFLVQASHYEKIERMRHFAKNLRLISVPSTLLKITQLQEQQKYLMLFGRGYPISPHTVAEKLGIENYGDIGGNTEFEKWVNWKKLELLLMAQAKAMAAELGLGEEPGATGKQHAGGRPHSDKEPPKTVVKDKKSNPRPVQKTSA